ncbi:MAG: hypothetical protein V1493_03215 [Candidatus Diapherotrites archaeon]
MMRALKVLKGALIRLKLKARGVPFYQKQGFLPMEIAFTTRFFEKRGKQLGSPWKLNQGTREALGRDLNEAEASFLAERSFERQIRNGLEIEQISPAYFEIGGRQVLIKPDPEKLAALKERIERGKTK